MRLKNNPHESQIVEIWRRLLINRAELITADGEPIKIIYPGRINDDRGADFRDVVIATSRGLLKGDIEIHVKSSDWQAHRHHHDPAYNRVVLHVVMQNDAKATTKLQNGKDTPTLALDEFTNSDTGQQASTSLTMPCLRAKDRFTPSVIGEFLDAVGEERFFAKAAEFQRELAQTQASQTLYQGIMGALGYAKNKIPMLNLAHRLPLQILEFIAQSKIPDEECLARQQALLLGTAGLLPSQRPNRRQEPYDEWTGKLERLWSSSYQTNAMSCDAWHLFKVRPNNFPTHRIAAISYLILHYREKGILAEIINKIKEVPWEKGYRQLETELLVTAKGYWASHLDFGRGNQAKGSTLLGKARAADIIVNVVLPFALAWSRHTSQPELGNKAIGLYRRYPRLAVNAVERHMCRQLGLSSSLVNSARRQQGLLHIYNTLCTQGRCHSCRLSQLEAGHHIQI